MCPIYDTFWLSAHSACLEDAMRELLYLFQSSFPHLLPDPKTWTFLQYCIRSSEANWLLAWTDKHYERLRAELSVPCTTKNISQKAITMQIFRHRRTPILAEPGSSSALSESSCTDAKLPMNVRVCRSRNAAQSTVSHTQPMGGTTRPMGLTSQRTTKTAKRIEEDIISNLQEKMLC